MSPFKGQLGSSVRTRLMLDWAIPAAGLVTVLAWAALFPTTPQDPRVPPFAGFLEAAFISPAGIAYVCTVVVWWMYRLFQHGGWAELLHATAIVLQVIGLWAFFGTRPLLGLGLAAAGLTLSALIHTRSRRVPARG